MKTHYVSFADNTVAIDYESETAKTFIDYLFQDLDNSRSKKPLTRIRISTDSKTDTISLHQRNTTLYQGVCKSTLANILMEKILYPLVERNTSGLALHAAGLCMDQFGILIPGVSGAGKSTLSVWLASRGFNYLTDELVHIPLDRDTMEGFTRPINIKKRGVRVLKKLKLLDNNEVILKNNKFTLLPHQLINPAHKKQNPNIRLILFPNIARRGSKHKLVRIPKALAGLKMMESLVNARNLPNHGLDRVSELVCNAPAYELKYRGFKTLPDLLAEVLPAA